MNIKRLLPILLVVAFSFLASLALFLSGLPPTHDGEYHIIRFYEFNKVLQSGVVYPRWAPDLNNGYGVPLFTYVYPLPNYIASLFHLMGVSFINAFKYQMIFALILGALFFYGWAKKFWSTTGAVVASVFYTFSPYHFLDIYVRGSVGEVWALTLFPLSLWAITSVIQNRNKKAEIFFVLSLTLLIISHNILALMFFCFLCFYIMIIILHVKNKIQLSLLCLFLITLSLGLSSVFWLPALVENKYVTGLQIYDIAQNFPDLYQLIVPSWGSGFSNVDLQNQMSFQIGIANLMIILLTMPLCMWMFIKKKKNSMIVVFFLCSFLIVAYLMLSISLPLWKFMPLMHYFQFPWRFLSLIIILTSFLAGSIFSIFPFKASRFLLWSKYFLAGLLIFFAVSLSISYASVAYYHNRDDNYYITRSNFIDGTNSVGNYFNTIWFNRTLKKQKERIRILKGDASINKTTIRPQYLKFFIIAKTPTDFIVNIAYFPGWEILIDNKKQQAQKNSDGLIIFNALPGKHTIVIQLKNTPIQLASFFFASISLGLFIFLFIKNCCVTIKQ